MEHLINDYGEIEFYIKDCMYKLGLTKSEIKNGKTYTSYRWHRLKKHLAKIGLCPTNLEIKHMTISKGDLIKLCSLMNTDGSVKLQLELNNKMYNDDLNIDKYIELEVNKIKVRKEIEFIDNLKCILGELRLEVIAQYRVLSYRIDCYIPELNIAIEYDEDNHKNYTYEQHEGRQLEIEKELGCKFIRVSDEYSVSKAIGIVLKEIFANELKVS